MQNLQSFLFYEISPNLHVPFGKTNVCRMISIVLKYNELLVSNVTVQEI